MPNDPATAENSLGHASSIHRTASVRATTFGRYCEVGARTKVAESSFGDYPYVVNDRRAYADQSRPGAAAALLGRGDPELLAIAWWDWPHARIGTAMNDFRALGAEAFCAKYASC